MNMPRTQLSFRLIIGLVLTFSLALGGVTPVFAAQRCYVKAGAGGTGTSWANPYGNPQGALANAACTEIWVAKGIYKPTSGTDRFVSFALKNGVALYGGFAGTETLLSQRKPALNLTILSGQIGALDQSDNSYHVVLGSGVNATAILDGFQIKDGFAANGLGGAGMLNTGNASPTLRNLTFTNNLATYGGGMYNENSSPSLSKVTIVGNSGTNGVGMYNFSNSNASLTDVTFINNSASGGGGGLFNDSSSPILVNVTFSGNQANLGAGMFSQNAASSPSLTNVTFSGNIAATSGGAMYNYNSSTPNLRNVTISGNSAPSGGGMINESSNPVVTNAILYGDLGGEIVNNSSTPSVTFSIVQGGWPGTGNLDTNPRLKPLGSYGGYGKTMPLAYGSPAIDAGTNVGCPAADQRGIARPQDGDLNGISTCDMGATESRLFAKSFPSLASQDGYVLESTETSGTGGSLNSTEQILKVGDSTARQQGRSILSFNTATLPDTVQVVSAVLRLKQAAISSPSPFSLLGSLLVDVRKGPFGNNPALQLADFEAPASKLAATTIPFSVTGVYVKAMPAASYAYINKLGLTQFRLRFSLDDNNDNISNFVNFYSGNATTASLRPVLSVKYYMP
ncbi:MAG TPA: choice-of-anchor Q domain-containing protein [Anaerolineales bacterium]